MRLFFLLGSMLLTFAYTPLMVYCGDIPLLVSHKASVALTVLISLVVPIFTVYLGCVIHSMSSETPGFLELEC